MPFIHSYSASMGSSFFYEKGFSILPKDPSACRWGRLGSNHHPSSQRTAPSATADLYTKQTTNIIDLDLLCCGRDVLHVGLCDSRGRAGRLQNGELLVVSPASPVCMSESRIALWECKWDIEALCECDMLKKTNLSSSDQKMLH